jgi:hypothetical protein
MLNTLAYAGDWATTEFSTRRLAILGPFPS